MAAELIEGEALAAEIRDEVAGEVAELARAGRGPHLAALMVGDNAGCRMYARQQAKHCEAVGIGFELVELPDRIAEGDLQARIDELNRDDTVTGLLPLMPMPARLRPREVQMSVDPAKDVEGVHPANLGRLFYGEETVAPCTAMAAVELLTRTVGGREALAGLETVIVGHSEVFGKPCALMLLESFNMSPTVRVCHVATRDLAAHTRDADVVIVATGVRQRRWEGYKLQKKQNHYAVLPDLSPLVTADMLRADSIVIDVAINRIPKGFDADGQPLKNDKGKAAMQTVGDVDFDAAKDKVRAITPVPGGVGPVTVSMLLRNTVACARVQSSYRERPQR